MRGNFPSGGFPGGNFSGAIVWGEKFGGELS